MSLPEFDIEGPLPPTTSSSLPPLRPWVWLCVALLIALLSAAALYSISAMPGVTRDRAALERVVRKLGSELNSDSPFIKSGPASKEFLLRAKQELAAVPLTTKGAKGSRERALLVIRQQLEPGGKPDFSKLGDEADDIENKDNATKISKRRRELNAALREVYSGKPISANRATELRKEIAGMSGGAFPYGLTLNRLDTLSGPTKPDEGLAMILGAVALFLLVGGVGAWVFFVVYRIGGGRPVGVPIKGTIGDGDDLGLRMLIFLLCFIGLPVLIGPLFSFITDSSWAEAATWIVIVAVVFYLITRRYGNVKRTLREIGWRSNDFGKDVLFGVGAWLANWPVIVVLFFAGKMLLSWIPSGEHPLQREFMEPSARLPLLFSAVVIAPLLEETTFRGLLFQGLFLRIRSLFWAAFLAGFAFASIHPQGGALWLSIGWIGAMGALLTHERGSLVPAITMHALHNGTLLLLSLAAG